MTKYLLCETSISQVSSCHIFVINLERNLYFKLFIKIIYITNSFRKPNSHWKVCFYYGFCICNRKKQEVLLYRYFLFCITVTTLFYHCIAERKNRKEACHGKQEKTNC